MKESVITAYMPTFLPIDRRSNSTSAESNRQDNSSLHNDNELLSRTKAILLGFLLLQNAYQERAY